MKTYEVVYLVWTRPTYPGCNMLQTLERRETWSDIILSDEDTPALISLQLIWLAWILSKVVCPYEESPWRLNTLSLKINIRISIV